MDKQLNTDINNENVTIEQISIENKEERGTNQKSELELYKEQLAIYEKQLAKIDDFRKELKELFHKSQDTFEKQLSFISAGALALSVGFIKDIVDPIKLSRCKWMLLTGWGLLIFTLLLNLISHMLAGRYAKKGAKEAEDPEGTYDPVIIDKRAEKIECLNFTTVATLACGIVFIVLYITLNAVYGK